MTWKTKHEQGKLKDIKNSGRTTEEKAFSLRWTKGQLMSHKQKRYSILVQKKLQSMDPYDAFKTGIQVT